MKVKGLNKNEVRLHINEILQRFINVNSVEIINCKECIILSDLDDFNELRGAQLMLSRGRDKDEIESKDYVDFAGIRVYSIEGLLWCNVGRFHLISW